MSGWEVNFIITGPGPMGTILRRPVSRYKCVYVRSLIFYSYSVFYKDYHGIIYADQSIAGLQNGSRMQITTLNINNEYPHMAKTTPDIKSPYICETGY